MVSAQELDVDAILAGLRAGRCWIAESAGLQLSFTASAGELVAEIGDELKTDGQPVELRIETSGVPSATVSFHTDRGRSHYEALSHEGSGSIEWSTTMRESMFVRIEVRHPDGRMAALTNPILLT